MKKLLLLITIIFLGLLSCKKSNFLDDKSSSLIDENAVFSDSARTMAFLTRMYEEIGFNFNKGRWEGSGTTEQATDDAEYTLSNPARRTVALYLGAYGSESFIHSDAYNLPFVNIRRANLLLSKLPTTPLSEPMQARVRGEAKFMRAYFYTYLFINFGGMPLLGETLFDKDAEINLPRNSFEECVTYAAKEFDEAAALLPQVYPNNNLDYGRVTKGACMAMKARLLLFAASPLFNGGTIDGATAEQKKVAGYPDNNVARWQAAANAANAVITSGFYSLEVDNTTRPGYGFYNMFLKRVNTEYILFVNRAPNRDFEGFYSAPSRNNSTAPNTRPTQNIVECFPMKNGKAITDPTSGFDPAFPYYNRDPRFNYTIIYNGSRYQRANVGQDTVFTWQATASATNLANTSGDGYVFTAVAPTLTGYYCRKMCDSTVTPQSSGITNRGWPLLRYAEVVLSYAEAINETGDVQKAFEKMVDIRMRAGIDAGADGRYGIKAGITQAEMRELIRNERHIELAYEGDSRWDDIRRWKIAVAVNNGQNRLIVITRNPTTRAYTYTQGVSPAIHTFLPKQYLFPIPGIEIRKAPAMIQNPGW